MDIARRLDDRIGHPGRRIMRGIRRARTSSEAAPVGDVEGGHAANPAVSYDAMQAAAGVPLFRSLPVPGGWTIDRIDQMLRSFEVDGGPRGELAAYVDDSLWRFLHTWDMASAIGGSALELGANPYFTTVLMKQFSPLELTLANYFGPDRAPHGHQSVRFESAESTSETIEMDFDHFDVEHDAFPYRDGQFDIVLFCEIIEHLLEDPVHSLTQISRVLKPGGSLILTTPNVARLENVVRMVEGANIYDPYSGFGPYGRHNREYNLHDLAVLLSFCGFRIEEAFTADAHPWTTNRIDLVRELTSELERRAPDLGQYIFVRAVKVAPPHPGRPSWLYRSLPEGAIVPFDQPVELS